MSDVRERLDELEDRIHDLEREIDHVKDSMITWWGLASFGIGCFIIAIWGEKIWEFIKIIFVLIAYFFLKLVNMFFGRS